MLTLFEKLFVVWSHNVFLYIEIMIWLWGLEFPSVIEININYVEDYEYFIYYV